MPVEKTVTRLIIQTSPRALAKLRAVQIDLTLAVGATSRTDIGGAKKTERDVKGVEVVAVRKSLDGKIATGRTADAAMAIPTTTALSTDKKERGAVRIATVTVTTGIEATDTEIDVAVAIRTFGRYDRANALSYKSSFVFQITSSASGG